MRVGRHYPCDAVAFAVQVRLGEVEKIKDALRFAAEKVGRPVPSLLFTMVNKSSGERFILHKDGQQ